MSNQSNNLVYIDSELINPTLSSAETESQNLDGMDEFSNRFIKPRNRNSKKNIKKVLKFKNLFSFIYKRQSEGNNSVKTQTSRRRRSIYPRESSRFKKKSKATIQDSFDYRRCSIQELDIPEERISNKFKKYQKNAKLEIGQMKRDYPCYYSEKVSMLPRGGKRFRKVEFDGKKIMKKKLLDDHSLVGNDSVEKEMMFRRKVQKRSRKFVKKFGFGKVTSKLYAKANLRMKKRRKL